MSMLNACPEHPDITHILRTGYPLAVKYPERDDVEVVEVDVNEIRRNEDESDQIAERLTYNKDVL